ncbi:MAG TPA: protein kinase [Pyrinomonadaceae bacterium]|jgi:serine/threonine-protein kinase
MKSERWRQVDGLFERALELDAAERAAFLDAACAGDRSLRREVEEMLGFDARAEDFIETPVFGVAAALIGAMPEAPTRAKPAGAGAGVAATPGGSRPRTPSRDSQSLPSIDESRFVPGDVLAGRYRIAGLLGRGGMGEVYRADDLKLKQPVALKFLPESFSTDGAALARFYQEVSVARQISHRHVCRVYDVAEAEGSHFISMEYVRGEELSSLLKRIGRLPGDKAVETARQLCAGLAAVHEAGVLHRDLKPANVMIDERGDVRITDFGIAALAGDVRGREALAGTPAYMSPEQLGGRELNSRSDIYSLGLVLYELFTGKRAFEASSLPELLRLRRSDTQPSSPSSHIKDLDPAVERVIFHCLERDPEKRPATALQVAAALPGGDPLAAALAAGETPSPEMVAAAPKEGALRPAVAVSMLAAALASLALVFVLSGEMLMLRWVPMNKPPEVLAERARAVVGAAGQAGAPADSAYGFGMDLEYYSHVAEHDRSMTRWERLRTGQPALYQFWYRQSPQPLEPLMGFEVTARDPAPQLYSGMADVWLDTAGRLVELRVTPPEVEEPGGEAVEPDWAPLFAEAGLDPTKFTPAESRWVPYSYADRRAAWEGVFPLQPETPLRVEAASYRGRPVAFKLVAPWDKAYRMQPYATTPGVKRLLMFVFAVFVTLLVAAAWLARRNFRLGRGDRRGAAKLALFVFATTLVANLVGASHVPTFVGEVWVLYALVKRALFNAALLWLLYIALEPYVRRRSPHRLISWTRLLAGDWRDPLVGRDVLIGSLLGIWMNLCMWVGEITARRLGIPPDLRGVQPDTLLGVRGIAPLFLGHQPANALLHGLGFVFMLFLLSLVLRGERRGAVGAFVLFFGALALQGMPPYALLFYGALAAAYIFVASRFGMLALTVAQFVFFMIEFYPYTADPSAWYAGITLFAASVVVALAVYGFRTSLAGRPLLRGRLLED